MLFHQIRTFGKEGGMIYDTFFISGDCVLAMGVPIGISLGVASVAGIAVIGSYQLELIAQSMIQRWIPSADGSSVLHSAGEIMGQGGISKRLLNTAEAFFGRYTGGLGM